MNILLKSTSQILGTMPFNYLERKIHMHDFALMAIIPMVYYYTFFLAMFEGNALMSIPECKNICMLGNAMFIEIGVVSFTINFILSIVRMKRFYPDFYEKLENIDSALKSSALEQNKSRDDSEIAKAQEKVEKRWLVKELIAVAVVAIAFLAAIYVDVSFVEKHFKYYYFVSISFTFPYFTTCLIQGQFISLINDISKRLFKLNTLFENINQECTVRSPIVKIFDTNLVDPPKPVILNNKIISTITNEEKKTSEHTMTDLFRVHEKILSLSVMTNNEFAPQIVPFMTMCFCITLYGIFIETKVIFVAGGINDFLDYIANTFVIWSIITIFVAYLVLRLCCNAYNDMKKTAMIIHEIMQKKPPFMLGSDLYYNKMKAFTLQYLHWEGYFQFNGCGLFSLDYTFIFSSVSAATSYLIVLLQFDMSAILKFEGLSE
ncbi:Gr33a family protein [Megaselia abdita]